LFKRILDNRFVRKVLETEEPPEHIARGVAIGSFIAVTPTVGFQIYLALLLATLARGNRVAAIAMTFILNPFIVIPPSYWYFPAYYLGLFLLGMEGVGFSQIIEVYESTGGLYELMSNLWSLGIVVYGPMLLGGTVMGVPIAFVMYHASLRLVVRHRARRAEESANKDAGGPSPPKDAVDDGKVS
jgi:uncharacterized protein (DUF2062 family)